MGLLDRLFGKTEKNKNYSVELMAGTVSVEVLGKEKKIKVLFPDSSSMMQFKLAFDIAHPTFSNCLDIQYYDTQYDFLFEDDTPRIITLVDRIAGDIKGIIKDGDAKRDKKKAVRKDFASTKCAFCGKIIIGEVKVRHHHWWCGECEGEFKSKKTMRIKEDGKEVQKQEENAS